MASNEQRVIAYSKAYPNKHIAYVTPHIEKTYKAGKLVSSRDKLETYDGLSPLDAWIDEHKELESEEAKGMRLQAMALVV